jgi:hypothetical protein
VREDDPGAAVHPGPGYPLRSPVLIYLTGRVTSNKDIRQASNLSISTVRDCTSSSTSLVSYDKGASIPTVLARFLHIVPYSTRTRTHASFVSSIAQLLQCAGLL